MAQEQDKNSGAGTSKYAYVASLYFVVVGVLYLWGYWPAFEVNILEYVGLTDIIKTAAYPIASLFVFFALGAFIGEFLTAGDTLPAGGGADTRTGRFLRKIAPFVAAVYVVGMLLLFFAGPIEKWRVLPALAAVPPYLLARRNALFSDLIASDNIRSILVFLLAALPFFAYGHGRLKAHAILSGDEYTYVRSAVGSVPAGNEPTEKRPRYLGVAGGYAFFYLPEQGTTIVASLKDVKVMELTRHKQGQELERSLPANEGSSTSRRPASSSSARPSHVSSQRN